MSTAYTGNNRRSKPFFAEAASQGRPPALHHDSMEGDGLRRRAQSHVLLVDDDVSILDVSTFILQQNGYAVSMASNGKDALVMLNGSVNSSNPVDLVITDLTMPVMSGVDFITEMRKRDFSVPVVVTTGCIESYSEAEIRKMKADHILFKPFNPANLTYCVKTILARPSSRRPGFAEGYAEARSGALSSREGGKPRENLDELSSGNE
jgi:DNA-binding response OmpR family regulator